MYEILLCSIAAERSPIDSHVEVKIVICASPGTIKIFPRSEQVLPEQR